MGPPENGYRKFQEVLRKSKKEVEKGPYIARVKNGPSNTPAEKGSSVTPSRKGPIRRSKREYNSISFGDNNIKIRQDISYRNWPTIKGHTTMTPVNTLPPYWKYEYTIKYVHWDFLTPKYKFNDEEVTLPPSTKSINKGALILRAAIGFLGLGLVLFIIYRLMSKKNRTRRGVVLAVRAGPVVQFPQTNRRTPAESGEPGPQTNDLPPPYQDPALYSMNEYVFAVPQTYTSQGEQPNTFIENERRVCSENVAPEMRMDLVFDNGRVVERSSLDADSKTDKSIACGQPTLKK